MGVTMDAANGVSMDATKGGTMEDHVRDLRTDLQVHLALPECIPQFLHSD